MAEAFKDTFNNQFIDRFADRLQLIVGHFDRSDFAHRITGGDWENKAYKQRVNHMASVMGTILPRDYKEAVALLLDLLDKEREHLPDFSKIDDKDFQLLTLEYGAILDSYIAQYGLHDFETSVKAIEKITQFTTCEFCVRPFIINYPNDMMKQMLAWSTHEHWGVRRLASEGCRPRLPWGMALPHLKADPAPILPVLENLKNDPSRFVRLSVANNLNDIAKDNPETVIDLAKRWHGASKEVDWVVKHGCRTLLKQGNPEVMALFGFDAGVKNIAVTDLQIQTPQVRVGNFLAFSFNLLNNRAARTKIRLEYAIYYQKANGTLTKKVHKISEKEYAGNSATTVNRKHSFRVVTTRKLHPGLHQVAVVINGNEMGKLDFYLSE